MNRPADGQEAALDGIRREIDAIDDGIYELLEKRFAAIEKVRSVKAIGSGGSYSPLRPAREAAIVDRLVARSGRRVPAELLVRIWRALISAATVQQADITIHVDSRLGNSVPFRLMIQDHFGSIPISICGSETDSLVGAGGRPSDLALVATDSAWAPHFAAGPSGGVRVIGCLPYLRKNAVPDLLVFGHATPEDTGKCVTVVVTNIELHRSHLFSILWQTASGAHWVSGLSGFHSDNRKLQSSLVDVGTAPGVRIVGHYPSPIEAGT